MEDGRTQLLRWRKRRVPSQRASVWDFGVWGQNLLRFRHVVDVGKGSRPFVALSLDFVYFALKHEQMPKYVQVRGFSYWLALTPICKTASDWLATVDWLLGNFYCAFVHYWAAVPLPTVHLLPSLRLRSASVQRSVSPIKHKDQTHSIQHQRHHLSFFLLPLNLLFHDLCVRTSSPSTGSTPS